MPVLFSLTFSTPALSPFPSLFSDEAIGRNNHRREMSAGQGLLRLQYCVKIASSDPAYSVVLKKYLTGTNKVKMDWAKGQYKIEFMWDL